MAEFRRSTKRKQKKSNHKAQKNSKSRRDLRYKLRRVSLTTPKTTKEVRERVRHLYNNYRRYLQVQVSFFVKEGVIRVDDPDATVEAFISLSEGSHYFCRFHIENGTFDNHCRHMIAAAKRILGAEQPGIP